MDTVRQRIKAAYMASVTEGVPSVEGRVHAQRKPRLAKGSYPALSVHVGDTQRRAITTAFPRVLENRMEFSVIGYADEAIDDVDDVLEVLAGEIEKAMAGSAWRAGGLVKSLTPTRMRLPDPQDRDASGGIVGIAWEAVFYTTEGDPSQSR